MKKLFVTIFSCVFLLDAALAMRTAVVRNIENSEDFKLISSRNSLLVVGDELMFIAKQVPKGKDAYSKGLDAYLGIYDAKSLKFLSSKKIEHNVKENLHCELSNISLMPDSRLAFLADFGPFQENLMITDKSGGNQKFLKIGKEFDKNELRRKVESDIRAERYKPKTPDFSPQKMAVSSTGEIILYGYVSPGGIGLEIRDSNGENPKITLIQPRNSDNDSFDTPQSLILLPDGKILISISTNTSKDDVPRRIMTGKESIKIILLDSSLNKIAERDFPSARAFNAFYDTSAKAIVAIVNEAEDFISADVKAYLLDENLKNKKTKNIFKFTAKSLNDAAKALIIPPIPIFFKQNDSNYVFIASSIASIEVFKFNFDSGPKRNSTGLGNSSNNRGYICGYVVYGSDVILAISSMSATDKSIFAKVSLN